MAVCFYNFPLPFDRTVQKHLVVEIRTDLPDGCAVSLCMMNTAIRQGRRK